MNLSIFSRIRCRVTVDNILRILLRSTMGRRLAGGPGGFFGLGRAMRVPWPMVSMGACCSKAVLIMVAIG